MSIGLLLVLDIIAKITCKPAAVWSENYFTFPPSPSCSSGQFVSQYPTDTATFASQSVTQPTMLSLQQPHVVQSTGYYDASTLPQLQQGLGHLGIQHTGQDHLGPITHTTRAHPQTVRFCSRYF